MILITLRLLQGLALGGEYGGAATYVAEHAPPGKRGFYTSFIQTTATFGLFLSLIVILVCRKTSGKEDFDAWGWRIPFLLSVVLLLISVYIRLQLHESPLFQQMKAEGRGSKAPLTESFAHWSNGKIVLLALFGATAGQAVVWYGGQFYALFFLTQTSQDRRDDGELLIAGALLIATPFFVVFGALSDQHRPQADHHGRLPARGADLLPDLQGDSRTTAIRRSKRRARPTRSSSPPIRRLARSSSIRSASAKFKSSCDVAKSYARQARRAVHEQAAPAGTVANVKIGSTTIASFEGGSLDAARSRRRRHAFGKAMGDALDSRRLSGEGRSGRRQHADAAPAADHPRDLRDDGLRPDRRLAGRAVPDADPLHLDEPALSHRQRLVRRLPADDRVRARRRDRQYLFGPLVSVVIALMTLVIGTLFLRETKDVDISR